MIEAHHVAYFCGALMARIFSSNTLIDTISSVHKCLDSVPCVKEAITQDAYKDLYGCKQFVDDWETDLDEEWDEFFHDTKVVVDDTTANHQLKFGIIEDGFNSRWQEIINFGR